MQEAVVVFQCIVTLIPFVLVFGSGTAGLAQIGYLKLREMHSDRKFLREIGIH